MIAAILICGTTTFTSCTKQDNPVNPADNLAEKIIGKWIIAERDGQPMPSNEKIVFTFVSATKAYRSASLNTRPELGTLWSDQLEADVTISGNKITATFHDNEHTTAVHEFIVTAINGREFTANHKVTVTMDGNVMIAYEDVVRLVKQTADYQEPILGLWECEGLIGDETYNDGNDRLEFLSDGTYRFYHTRWKNQGEDELREWWEIESISGDEMVWTALRQNADGTTFQQKMTWKRIDLNVAEKILGKWINNERNGQPMISGKKMVITFASTTKAYMSESLNSRPEAGAIWNEKMETAVSIVGNKVTVTFHRNEHHTGVHEYIITEINDNEFTANHKVTSTVDGNVVHIIEDVVRYTKVTADFREAIVGTWEGRCTSEGSVFDDGQEHRWQYKADGTYVYYVKDGDDWVPSENTLNEYFVDGTLLCTRWVDNEQENREWWEITISGDKMNWTALRQKEDGTTFTATFEMTKVQ